MKIIRMICGWAVVAATVLTISCNGGGSENPAAGQYPDTAQYVAQSDTLSELLGRVNGMSIMKELIIYKTEIDSTYHIPDFMEGVSMVLDERYPGEYLNGLAFGMTMANEMAQHEAGDLKYDRNTVINSYRKALKTDSITPEMQEKVFSQLQELVIKGKDADTQVLSHTYGTLAGYTIAADLREFQKSENKKADMEAFNAAAVRVISAARSDAFLAGIQNGLAMRQGIGEIEKMGVNIRPATVLKYFKAAGEQQAVDEKELETYGTRLADIMNRIQDKYNKAREERIMREPATIQNIKTGQALVNKLKKQDSRIKTTDSGISYLINTPGTGKQVTDSSMVKARFTTSRLDGRVIETDTDALLTPATCLPGLQEALLLLKEGDKATFYIPGNLAYGVNGYRTANAEVGSMETIVADIEIKKVD